MVAQFNGAAAGQTVFHLHFHVIPRWTDRPDGAHGRHRADPATLEAQASQWREALR